MRKLSIFLVLSFSCSLGFSQLKKGAILVGGNIAFSRQESSGFSGTSMDQASFAVVPAIGLGIKDNLCLGIYLSYYSNRNNTDLSSNDFKEKQYGGGVFIRKYKQIGKSDFSIFLQARAGIEYNNEIIGDNTPQKGETDIFRILASVYPGISFRVSKRLQLESGFTELLGIRYSHSKGYNGNSPLNQFEQKAFTIYTNLDNVGSFYVGFRLLFNK